MPSVHVTGPVPPEIEAALAEGFELLPSPAGADGILALLGTPVGDPLFDRAGPQLRIVANYAVGVDNVDLEAARRRGIVITNTPDVLTDATAELAIALTLSLLRRVTEGDRLVRSKTPWRFALEFMLGRSLRGARFLVVGAGRIGRATGELAAGLGAEVVYAGRNDDLHALLADADVVSLHCPLTPETRHLIDAAALAAMKPTAVLVNTARGPVVDEQALVAALRDGAIGGAALDVYEREPEVTEELLPFENAVLTPHLGSATRETRIAMGMLAVSALRDVLLHDRKPANSVD